MTRTWLDSINKKQPLSYNPSRNKFISLIELISEKEEIYDVDKLSADEKKILVIQRLKKGPEFSMQSISGELMNKSQMIIAITKNEEIGKMMVEAEISMLRDLLNNFKKLLALKNSRK